MGNGVQIDSRFNYAVSQIFSPALLNKLHTDSHLHSVRELLQTCNIYKNDCGWNYNEAIACAYEYLKKNYRCEYVYMNEIANQLLLEYHSDNSATLLKEVYSDSSIADIVIINGDTVAYEIKTELDNFERLNNQLSSYDLLYDYVNVVTHPQAVENVVKRTKEAIGIIVLDENGLLKTVRKAAKNNNTFSPSKAILTMRQAELVYAYEKYVGIFPKMGTAEIFMFCYNWYIELDNLMAHSIFKEALKSRKLSPHQFELVKKVDSSLKMIFLGKPLTKKFCITTMNKICTFG